MPFRTFCSFYSAVSLQNCPYISVVCTRELLPSLPPAKNPPISQPVRPNPVVGNPYNPHPSMASTSRTHGVTGRIRTATTNLHEDNQSLISDIGKAFSLMKEIAVDFERAEQFEKVKELENAVVELVATYEDCSHFSSAIESVGHKYQPGPELTDFHKLFKNEVAQLKANSSSVPQNHPLIRQFREAVWKVHHAGEPMPGEEQEDIVMTSNQSTILNVTCPLSGKPVTELEHPVRSVLCKHVYDKGHIMHYLLENNTRCPVAACPAKLKSDKVKDDPLLAADIDELRKTQNQNVMTDVMDVTEFEE